MARTVDYALGETADAPDFDIDLTAEDMVKLFEESEDASYDSRIECERDRDYYDNKQLTGEEIKTLKKRGQPPVITNRIKPKIDFLVGLEKQQRIDPKCLPRTPMHEQDADAATQALRYVADVEDFDAKRSAIWKNILIEGTGGMSVSVADGPDGVEIKLRRWAWDRLFWDPHSCELDFSDASYVGGVIWMDYDEALTQYPDGREALDVTMASVAHSETYDDKPKYLLWADKKRKRVRICQVWLKRGEKWFFAEFTKGGILKAGPSPYLTDRGESDCEMFLQSAYVDRDNNRYGNVRTMISPQDEINKRRSKSLHLLNTSQIVMEEGALSNLNDVERVRREAAKPDGVIILAPSGDGIDKKFQFNTRSDLAEGHFKLLQQATNEIDLQGPNATMQGDKAQGSASASGKAIIASQQGGMIELGDLLDSLRHLDKRVFRAIWNRIRQFWTAEKWIRVTDDERNVKWVGMNVDPMMVQMQMQQDPAMAEKIAGVVANIAELDCDITVDEAPDSVTPQLEQWQALVELATSGIPIPPDVLIEAAPNLKNKDKLLERMNQPNPVQQAQQQLEFRGAEAEVAGAEAKVVETQAAAELKQAQTMKTVQEAQLAPLEAAGKVYNDMASRAMNANESAAERQSRERQGMASLQSKERSEQLRSQQRRPEAA